MLVVTFTLFSSLASLFQQASFIPFQGHEEGVSFLLPLSPKPRPRLFPDWFLGGGAEGRAQCGAVGGAHARVGLGGGGEEELPEVGGGGGGRADRSCQGNRGGKRGGRPSAPGSSVRPARLRPRARSA